MDYERFKVVAFQYGIAIGVVVTLPSIALGVTLSNRDGHFEIPGLDETFVNA